jgi:hypothetical protein
MVTAITAVIAELPAYGCRPVRAIFERHRGGRQAPTISWSAGRFTAYCSIAAPAWPRVVTTDAAEWAFVSSLANFAGE